MYVLTHQPYLSCLHVQSDVSRLARSLSLSPSPSLQGEPSTSSSDTTDVLDNAALVRSALRAPLGADSILDPLGELDMTRSANRDALTRLQSLLKGVGDGEEELFLTMFSEETADTKVLLHTAAGVLVLFGAFLLCVLIKSDPLGGMRLGPHSLAAGVVGLIAGMPLVVFRVFLWSEEMRARCVAFAGELHDTASRARRSAHVFCFYLFIVFPPLALIPLFIAPQLPV